MPHRPEGASGEPYSRRVVAARWSAARNPASRADDPAPAERPTSTASPRRLGALGWSGTAEIRTLDAGAVLLTHGEALGGLYLVLDGELAIRLADGDVLAPTVSRVSPRPHASLEAPADPALVGGSRLGADRRRCTRSRARGSSRRVHGANGAAVRGLRAPSPQHEP